MKSLFVLKKTVASLQKAQSMAQLNWRPGMWPQGGGTEFGGWDYPSNPSLLSQIGVVEGPMRMKRTPSNLSMSGIPDGMCWPGQPAMMHHPMMYPAPPFHPSMMWTGSQSQLAGPMMMMMNPHHSQQFGERSRPVSPASSQRSRRSSIQKSSSQRSSQNAKSTGSNSSSRHAGSSSKTHHTRWSDSDDDERFSGHDSDDSVKQDRSIKSNKGARSKDYGPVRTVSSPVRPSPKRSSNVGKSKWECQHCTFVNEADTRICAVCCRTSDFISSEPAEEELDLPVVKSNLTFNIKEDRKIGATSPTVAVQLKNEQLGFKESKTKSEDVSKNYEDVSNMLKRMQVRREESSPTDYQPYKSSLENEIDAVEDDEEEEGYIEMEEKEPFYEHVSFPPAPARPPSSSSSAVEDRPGKFSSLQGQYLAAAERSKRARFEDY